VFRFLSKRGELIKNYVCFGFIFLPISSPQGMEMKEIGYEERKYEEMIRRKKDGENNNDK